MTTKKRTELLNQREKLLSERTEVNKLSFSAMNKWFKKMNELDEKIKANETKTTDII